MLEWGITHAKGSSMPRIARRSVVLTVLAASAACKTPGNDQGYQLRDTEVRNFEDELGMKPAVGFEGILEDVRGVCVDFDGLEPTGASQEATYSIRLVENHAQLVSHLGVSAGAQVKAAMPDANTQASKKTKFALGTTFSVNRYSVYLLVSARIRNETTHLKNTRMKATATQRVAQGVPQFRQQCGDSFLTGFSTGGEYQAVIEIKSESEEATAGLKSRYSSQVGDPGRNEGVTTHVGLDAGLRALASGRDVRIWTYQRGGVGEAEVGLVTSLDDMMTRLRRLADTVKQGNNPRPLTATFTDYLTLGANLPGTYVQQLSAAKDVIKELAAAQASLLDLQANLDFIMIQPHAFVGVDAAKLAQIRDTKQGIESRIKKIHEAGRACSLDLATCKKPAEAAAPAFDLPRRKPTIDSLAQEKIRVRTKLTFLDANGLRDGWWNPAECYLTVSAAAPGKTAIPIRRTETTYGDDRCRNLQTDLSIPVAIAKDAWSRLGVAPSQGQLELILWEDDPSYDDNIGSTSVGFSELQNGAVLKGINTPYINMEAGFEIEY